MAEKGKGVEGTSPTSSRSTSDNEDVSDGESDDNVIQSDLQTEMGDQGEVNATAVDDFLDQVSGSTSTTTTTTTTTTGSHHPDPDARRTARAAEKDHSGEQRQQAKRAMAPPECRCQLNGGRPCHTRFGAGELMEVRAHYLGMRRGEVDIAVLAKLECGIHLTPMTTRKKRRPTARQKHRTDFYHRGFRICNVMFVYLHGFSYKKLKALILQYKTNGVRTRVHKNIKPRPAETPVPQPKRTKSKAKAKAEAKLTAKEPRARKNVDKKVKTTKRAEGGKGETSSISSLCQNSICPPRQPPPPLPAPAPPVQPPHPVTFPLPTHPHPHHPAHPFSPAVGYDVGGASGFTPHPMTLHTPPAPQSPNVLSSLSAASMDYCGQPGMTTYPSLDFSSGHSTSGHTAASFPATPHPCVTYSVVHNVTF